MIAGTSSLAPQTLTPRPAPRPTPSAATRWWRSWGRICELTAPALAQPGTSGSSSSASSTSACSGSILVSVSCYLRISSRGVKIWRGHSDDIKFHNFKFLHSLSLHHFLSIMIFLMQTLLQISYLIFAVP